MDILSLPAQTISVKGSNMYYVTIGKGKPVVFIHGMPTSSYVWRKVISKPALRHRCVAMDLIGMGQSDKPDISYTINEHIEYFKEFMDKLDLNQPATIVMHGWGSIVGLAYARANPEKVRGLVLIEPYINLAEEYYEVSSSVNELTRLAADNPQRLETLMIEENYMVEKIMPMLIAKRLPEEDFNVYRKPYEKKEHRKVLLQFALEQPHREINSPVLDLVKQNSDWLEETAVPKLLMYSNPGFLTRMNKVIWVMNHLSNITVVEVGNDFHYLPETCAPKMEQVLAGWLLEKQ